MPCGDSCSLTGQSSVLLVYHIRHGGAPSGVAAFVIMKITLSGFGTLFLLQHRQCILQICMKFWLYQGLGVRCIIALHRMPWSLNRSRATINICNFPIYSRKKPDGNFLLSENWRKLLKENPFLKNRYPCRFQGSLELLLFPFKNGNYRF